ncbi:nucleobase-ascorbate transporter 11-like isoform X4 [Carya illinoinensis]|uniref:nucleobase-ascorbate transporter 11-like isoform X4 n=1 Tax=Carya illinoinensis TaxID=32201 RepID=UPI001C7240B9|nr:nucleobase-ascorbate transporter 11-like isoform X4 [Carya illinoinensis]
METGSTSKSRVKAERVKDGGATRLSSMLQKIEPFMPRIDHNPNELRSWAKRTGFVSDYSGGTQASASQKNDSALFDLEKGLDSINGGSSPKIEIDPVLGRTKPNRGIEIEPVVKNERDGTGRGEDQSRRTGVEAKVDERKVGSNGSVYRNGNGNVNGNANANGNGNRNEVPVVAPAVEPKKDDNLAERDAKLDFPYGEEPAPGGWHRPSGMKCGLRENPGFVPLIYYGLQHYLSLAGSLIFIPSIIVPAMGGTDKFRHIMRELQGAIIVGSIFQSILGYSGLMSLFLRFINPVVVAPTVAAVGLAFFSYGFPEAGSCVEISIPQILLLLIFTLYLRGISIFGHRVFRIYALVLELPSAQHILPEDLWDHIMGTILNTVPLSIMIIWTYAFFLTAGGAYNYKGCSPDIPSSNILIDACRKHAYTMKHCRTDVSNAWRAAAWVRIPYPLQWGIPIFHLRTSMIMIIVSLVASVDSVGTYHSASVRVISKPPSPGIVSRGIAMEGFCSILAGLWGTGTGSTTLTENVHTIDITKVASRRAVEVGAVFLILFSFVGKVGAILASIPQALAASVLCFMWALIVALGLSTLQYSQTASFRNITIVGVALFLGLSIPAYFQQYQPESSLILPSYFVPYMAASSGPVHTGSEQLDFALNAILSLNMVVTLLVAFVLDNTVPGSRQERGVYIWSRAEEIANDPSLLSDYALPRKVARCFYWARCLGV